MLQLNQIWFGFDEEYLIEDLSCVIHAGHKVGIVGRNGIGKTTIFRLIRRELTPEEGEVRVPDSWQIGWLRQSVEVTSRSAIDYVMDGHRELREVEHRMKRAEERGDVNTYAQLHDRFDALGGYQAESQAGSILFGLGFAAADFDAPYESFSGGWRIRLNLAQTLIQPTDLLLLDEPTNHLDLEATVWLQRWMQRYRGTILCISHDREFLDRTVDSILHIDRRQGTMYRGTYSSFEKQLAERLVFEGKQFELQEKERKRMQRFVDRFRTYATKARQVQSRVKMIEKMTLTAPIRAISPYSFSIDAPDQMDRPMLSLDDAILGYGEHVVLSKVTERIYPGDRIALLGLNGAGKSTFLKALAGELELLAGSRECGMQTTIGYFAQHQLEQLDGSISAHGHLSDDVSLTQQQIRNFLGSWGFHGDDIFRPASTFSGGEKARLVLALIAREKPALLVLDEPTNHLDVEMREALGVALNEYEGAVLIVAHDQHLLRQCVDEYWLVNDGAVTHFEGDLDTYENFILDQKKQTDAIAKKSERVSKKQLRQQRAQDRESRQEVTKQQKEIESRIQALQDSLSHLNEILTDPQILQQLDNQELQRKMFKYGRMKKELERLENDWLEIAD